MVKWRVEQGDALDVLRRLPAGSVHTSASSPPYWGLRNYGVAGQLGLERTPEEYVGKMVEVFREVRRVLRDDGTLWLNLGDTYSTDTKWGGSSSSKNEAAIGDAKRGVRWESGCKPKDLVGIPWMVAFALRADGWYLRQEIIWSKANPMPESVTDRPTRAHEQIFLMSKSSAYFFDAFAIKEPVSGTAHARGGGVHPKSQPAGSGVKANDSFSAAVRGLVGERNKRSVWHVATAPYSGAHFATFPPKLIEPCILAGSSEAGCCPACGEPWARIVEQGVAGSSGGPSPSHAEIMQDAGATSVFVTGVLTASETVGWARGCECPHARPVPCTVLDPFSGAGTTGLVASRLGRSYLGIELNGDYVAMSQRRFEEDAPLFNRR